jgi:hypothetical protein
MLKEQKMIMLGTYKGQVLEFLLTFTNSCIVISDQALLGQVQMAAFRRL